MKKKYLLYSAAALTVLVPRVTFAQSCFTSVFGTKTCSYEEWIRQVWGWAMGIAVSLSIVMVIAAGILWMTSAGNPDKIGTAKKMIFGVLSGLGLLIMARVFLNFLGLGSLWIF